MLPILVAKLTNRHRVEFGSRVQLYVRHTSKEQDSDPAASKAYKEIGAWEVSTILGAVLKTGHQMDFEACCMTATMEAAAVAPDVWPDA
jgi:hypothetical protein